MKEDDIKYLAHAIFGDGEVWPQVLKQRDAWNLFGLVWEWATKQEWWTEFITYALNHEADPIDGIKVHDFCVCLIDPVRFPKLIVNFLREREKGEGDGAEI